MRRNIDGEIFVDVYVYIKALYKGTYPMYPTADLHLSEELYLDAVEFNPST